MPKEEAPSPILPTTESAGLSVSNSNSSKTLAPRSTAVNKQFESLSGRASPGISASLGRLAGSSTVEKMEDVRGGSSLANGVSRRNSLTGGTTRATLSSTTSVGGGLKIPARIRQTQDALKRDLNAVREFALSIDGALIRNIVTFETNILQKSSDCS